MSFGVYQDGAGAPGGGGGGDGVAALSAGPKVGSTLGNVGPQKAHAALPKRAFGQQKTNQNQLGSRRPGGLRQAQRGGAGGGGAGAGASNTSVKAQQKALMARSQARRARAKQQQQKQQQLPQQQQQQQPKAAAVAAVAAAPAAGPAEPPLVVESVHNKGDAAAEDACLVAALHGLDKGAVAQFAKRAAFTQPSAQALYGGPPLDPGPEVGDADVGEFEVFADPAPNDEGLDFGGGDNDFGLDGSFEAQFGDLPAASGSDDSQQQLSPEF